MNRFKAQFNNGLDRSEIIYVERNGLWPPVTIALKVHGKKEEFIFTLSRFGMIADVFQYDFGGQRTPHTFKLRMQHIRAAA